MLGPQWAAAEGGGLESSACPAAAQSRASVPCSSTDRIAPVASVRTSSAISLVFPAAPPPVPFHGGRCMVCTGPTCLMMPRRSSVGAAAPGASAPIPPNAGGTAAPARYRAGRSREASATASPTPSSLEVIRKLSGCEGKRSADTTESVSDLAVSAEAGAEAEPEREPGPRPIVRSSLEPGLGCEAVAEGPAPTPCSASLVVGTSGVEKVKAAPGAVLSCAAAVSARPVVGIDSSAKTDTGEAGGPAARSGPGCDERRARRACEAPCGGTGGARGSAVRLRLRSTSSSPGARGRTRGC